MQIALFSPKSTIINNQSAILVTGGTGFIGAYIIKELIQQGLPVMAIKRPTAEIPAFIDSYIFNQVKWIEGDILDITSLKDAMHEVGAIIHAAAIVSFNKSDRNNMYHVNVEGTKNVVNTALETGVKKMIHISSVAAIGRKLTGGTVNEKAQWEDDKANTHYAISKHNAELEVWRGFAEGLKGVILNPATVLGYGNWDAGSCGLFKSAYNEFKWYTRGINGFTDVEDLARITAEFVKADVNEERFIVCNDNWPFQKLFDTMANAFGKKKPSKEATLFLSGIAWRTEKIKSLLSSKKPLLTKESAKVANSFTEFDNTKLLNALPQFTYTALEETIKKACKKYLEKQLLTAQ